MTSTAASVYIPIVRGEEPGDHAGCRIVPMPSVMTEEERLQRIVRNAVRIASHVGPPYSGMASDIQRDAQTILDLRTESDASKQAWIISAAKGCRCCSRCWDCPCGGCLAGGICDDHRCTCDNPHENTFDEDDGEDRT